MIRKGWCIWIVLLLGGCSLFPEVRHRPVIRNPFPQISKVAVAPFFNLSTEPTVDGREFALAYYNELQATPGFEVVPMGVVENVLKTHQLSLDNPADAQRLAQILQVDAVVVGAVTDFSPYYPPRCGLHVEWFAADPCLKPILPGYGLPWGTPEESQIPDSLVYESEFAHARERLGHPTAGELAARATPPAGMSPQPGESSPPDQLEAISAETEIGSSQDEIAAPAVTDPLGQLEELSQFDPSLSASQGLQPGTGPARPVMKHTRVFNGNDLDFAAALADYADFREDARSGGWRSVLQRSNDFIRFCCHMHLAEMLTARGGAAETQVVWRWPTDR